MGDLIHPLHGRLSDNGVLGLENDNGNIWT